MTFVLMELTRMKLRKSTRSRRKESEAMARRTRGTIKAGRKRVSKRKWCVCAAQIERGSVRFPSLWTELRCSKQLCDGSVECSDGKVFPLHRIILSSVSPYFRALFTNCLLRDSQPQIAAFRVDVTAEMFSLVIDYAYTGTCQVTEDNVQSLLTVADRFEVIGIVHLCCEFLLQELRPHNCIGILRFAEHFFCTELARMGRTYLRTKFKQVCVENDELLSVSGTELRKLLSDDELNVKNEESVFKTMKEWVEVNLDVRKKYIYELVRCVRFGLMSYSYYIDKVLTWEPLNENTRCQTYMTQVSQFLSNLHAKPSSDADFQNPLARPRVPYEVLFAVGGWTAGSPTNFVETYDTRADRWLLCPQGSDVGARAYHGVATIGGLLYVIGGFDGADHFNTVRCFDPVLRCWSERACMYHARCYISVAVLDGMIYALGGYNGRSRMSSAERYDVASNQWHLIAPMKRQRSDASATTFNGKVYVVGGFTGQEVLRCAEMYDPGVDQWTYIRSMTAARSGMSLVAHRGRMYALGGFDGLARLSTAERYDAVTATWSDVPEMFSPRSNFAAVVLDDMIFVMGGFNGTTTIPYVECFDVDTEEWYDASPMNLNRSALSACVISDLPNACQYSYVLEYTVDKYTT